MPHKYTRRLPSERFWSKVQKVELPDACWPFIAGKDPRGYGLFSLNYKTISAHRFAWQEVAGEIPDETPLVLHTCDNPPCIRNDDDGWYEINGVLRSRRGHLWLGTYLDSLAKKFTRGRVLDGQMALG